MKANYVVIEDSLDGSGPLVIKDVGPWDKYATVTNAAEEVVEELIASRQLYDGQRLFYIDSAGNKDELLVKNGRFAGFAPIPK